MAAKFRLDRKGIVEILQSAAVGDLVQSTAQDVVSNVPAYEAHSGETVRADVRMGLSDRRRAVVALVHPSSDAIEAKHGILSQAVAAAGLTLGGSS